MNPWLAFGLGIVTGALGLIILTNIYWLITFNIDEEEEEILEALEEAKKQEEGKDAPSNTL